MAQTLLEKGFWNLGFRKGVREIWRGELSGLKVYEAGGLSVFKNFLLISQMFVVPLLIVTTKTDLGLFPF